VEEKRGKERITRMKKYKELCIRKKQEKNEKWKKKDNGNKER